MNTKKFLAVLFVVASIIFFLFALNVYAVTILKPNGGGTGLGPTIDPSDVGKCLQASDDSPFTFILSDCGAPASPDTSVQFNDGGNFGGDSGLTYNKTDKTLTLTNTNGFGATLKADELVSNQNFFFPETAGGTFLVQQSSGFVTPSDETNFTLNMYPGLDVIFQPGRTIGEINTFSINFGGSGYTVNDVLDIVDVDNIATGGQITVDTVNGSGSVLTATLTNAGVNYSVNTYSTSGGSGSSAVVQVETLANSSTPHFKIANQDSSLNAILDTSLLTTTDKTFTFPDENGTFCTTGSICSGYASASGYATIALANLASTAINASLIPASDNAIDLGSASKQWRDLYLSGSSFYLGSTGVKQTTDGDGAITFLGMGDGSDEDMTINLDDTSNTWVFSSSTGVTAATFGAIALSTNTLTLTGTGTINGLDAIDATGEATLEAALDLQDLQGAVTDAQVPNNITIDLATLASTVTVVDSTDATSSIAMFDSATGSLAVKTDAGLAYDASNGTLSPTILSTATITLTGTGTLNGLDAIDSTGESTLEGVLDLQDLQGAVTDAQVPNNITIDLATLATTVTTSDAGGDTTTFPMLAIDATGSLGPRTDAGLSFNATTNALTATTFIGAVTGNATTATALAADPADCGANTFAISIVALGTLTCATPTLGTDTAGNYVQSVTTSSLTGLTGGNAAAEGTDSALSLDESLTLSGDVSLLTGREVFGVNGIAFEGTTANTIETYITVTDPTVTDKTIAIPNASGTFAVSVTAPVTLSALGDVGCATCITSSTSAGGDLTGTYPNPTITTNAVALGTDTTGNYVTDLTAGTAIDVSGGGSETATVTVDWDSTEVEATTWGAGGNASNAWTFNLSGTDPVLTAVSGGFTMASSLTLNAAGVKMTGDGDGDITFLGIGDGASDSDEDFTLNLEDVANTIGVSSSTGVTAFDFGSIGLKTNAVTDSGLTATRVTFAGASGILSDDAGYIFTTASDQLTLGENGQDGSLKIFDDQAGTDRSTIFQPGTQTQDITYTLPVDDGTSGQQLQTDGAGVLSWAVAGGTASLVTVANEATDATSFPLFVTATTGDLGPKSNTSFTFDAATATLSSTLFVANTITANTKFVPDAVDGAALGDTTLQFSDLFLAEGGVINWDNGDATLTQVGNVVTLAGADLTVDNLVANTEIKPDAVDGAAIGDTTNQWSDLFLAEGGVINWDNGDATLTQVGNVVTLAGADLAVPDEAFGSTWDGSANVPTKNAVWDANFARGQYANFAQAIGGTTLFSTIGGSFPSTSGTTLADGTIYYIAVFIDKATTITGVRYNGVATGSYTADNFNGVALYSNSGSTATQVAISSNTATAWSSGMNTGKQLAFTGTYAAARGLYYIALLYNSSAQVTAPGIANGTVAVGGGLQENVTRFAVQTAAITTPPASLDISSQTATTTAFWAGLY